MKHELAAPLIRALHHGAHGLTQHVVDNEDLLYPDAALLLDISYEMRMAAISLIPAAISADTHLASAARGLNALYEYEGVGTLRVVSMARGAVDDARSALRQ